MGVQLLAGPAGFGKYPNKRLLGNPSFSSPSSPFPSPFSPFSPSSPSSPSSSSSSSGKMAHLGPVFGQLRFAVPIDACQTIQPLGPAARLPTPLSTSTGSESSLTGPDSLVAADLPDAWLTWSEWDTKLAVEQMVGFGPIKGSIVVVRRGECVFIQKARNLEAAGALGGIVIDSDPTTSSATVPVFSMSGDEQSLGQPNGGINIPFVFLFSAEGRQLISSMATTWIQKANSDMLRSSGVDLTVTSGPDSPAGVHTSPNLSLHKNEFFSQFITNGLEDGAVHTSVAHKNLHMHETSEDKSIANTNVSDAP
ncbi:unnamed protein product [Protopolystoma xenopodis]|uniref:PA domain-containing protein n=1 Tax=Protopolystoma xenopodis TaxID=117903 RepID=A0A448WD89_9PLAT|nr:unnamed protein product [Protopolystoma xenopodis]